MNKIKKYFKTNAILKITALVLALFSLILVTYSWIEGSSSITITSANNTIKTGTSSPKINFDDSSTVVIDLNQYIANYENLFLAPAKYEDGKIKIKRDNGNYTDATTDDIGNNYVEFEFSIKTPNSLKYAFLNSSMKVGSAIDNGLKISSTIDGETKVCTATDVINNAVFFQQLANSSSDVLVRIWYETTDTSTNKSVSLDLTIVGQQPQCPEDILDGSKISFYGGIYETWTPELIRILDGTTEIQRKPYNADKNVTLNNRKYYFNAFTEVDSVNYNLSHQATYNGYPIGENAQAGAFYGLYSSSYDVNAIDKKTATTVSTSLSTTLFESAASTNKVTATTTLGSHLTAAGTEYYVQYYGELDGEYTFLGKSSGVIDSSKKSIVELDVTSLTRTPDKTFKIITVVADLDNNLFYVADTDSATVTSKIRTVIAYSLIDGSTSPTTTGGTVRAGSSGTASSTSTTKVANKTNVTVYAFPNTGYDLVGWYDSATGGTRLATSATYTFSSVASDKKAYARFKKITFTVNAYAVSDGVSESSNGGTVKINSGTAGAKATGSVSYGDNVTLTATEKSGYTFDGWYSAASGGEQLSTSKTYTVSSVKAGIEAYARFTKIPTDVWSLPGTFNSWSTTASEFSGSGNTLSVTVHLSAGSYKFKLYKKTGSTDAWYGNNGTMTRSNCTNWTFSSSDGDCGITADADGDYVFTLDTSTKKLSVTYPNHRYIYFDSSSCSWFENDGAKLAVKPSSGSQYNYADKVTINNKNYWRFDIGVNETSLKVCRKTSSGEYNKIEKTIDSSKNLLTISSNCDGGSWGTLEGY